MKKVLLLALAVASTIVGSAQKNIYSNYFGFFDNGGLGTLQYKLAQGERNQGPGFGGGLHYAHYFGQHFGVSTGIQYSFVQATAFYDFTEKTEGLTSPDHPGVSYDLSTSFSGWEEQQKLGFLGIPVEFLYRTPLNRSWLLVAGLGVLVDFNVYGKYIINKGEDAISARFHAYGLEDTPSHRFTGYNTPFEKEIKDIPISVSLLTDLGMRLNIGRCGLYLGLYASYGLTNLVKESTNPLLTITNYNGTLSSKQTKNAHLLSAGVKLGFNIGWNHKPETEQ